VQVYRLERTNSRFPTPFFAKASQPGVIVGGYGGLQTGCANGFCELIWIHDEQGWSWQLIQRRMHPPNGFLVHLLCSRLLPIRNN
jgi:hypothetical protein